MYTALVPSMAYSYILYQGILLTLFTNKNHGVELIHEQRLTPPYDIIFLVIIHNNNSIATGMHIHAGALVQ